MRYASDDESRRLYTAFLTRHERCNFQQSVEWAQVKSNWKNEIILAEDAQGNITGGLSVLIRKIPLFGDLMYSPRGPVCDTSDADALRQLIEGAELLAMKYNAMALRMEPDVSAEDGDFAAALEALGCHVLSAPGFQPRHVFRVDLRGKSEEEVMAAFSAKARYNIRLSQRRGVTVREGTREDLAVFHALMAETARRDHFLARPLAYLQRVWDAMGPEHTCLLLAYYDGQPIAGAMPVFYGNKTWYAFGASADAHRKLMPCYLLQWEMIRRALARGSQVYDMRGVLEVTSDGLPNSGLYHFKRQFGGTLTEFLGEVYIPYRPMVWKLYRAAEKLYLQGRDLITTLHRGQRFSEPVQAPAPLPWSLALLAGDSGDSTKSA